MPGHHIPSPDSWKRRLIVAPASSFDWRSSGIAMSIVASMAFALVAPVYAQANEIDSSNLTDFSLEALLDMEVTSAAKREERLGDTAAAIFVITQDDIRRSGATNIPELLRMVPGVDVAQVDANKWAISARGFNSRFARKLLVMIDGRSVYTPTFSGVFWDIQDTLIEDIDRIEVIRGPGATLWGANAVNGVINIITKNAKDTQGTLLSVTASDQGDYITSARVGATIGNTSFRAYLKRRNYDEAFAPGGAVDDWSDNRAGFRMDWGERRNR